MASALACSVHEIRRAQRANGPAAVLGIGTANPENIVYQDEFPDLYFRITKSEHLTDLKDKLKRICQKSGIKKRFLHLNEELLDAHPDFNNSTLPSLDARIDIVSTVVPELAASAAVKAITDWGRPATDITHLIFSTFSSARTPSADRHLATLLGLRPSVCRTNLNLHGCYGGARALQLTKEVAENNRGARVLVASSEVTLTSFCGPKEGCFDTIIGQGLFGDGAGAVIVGADPVEPVERSLFEMVFASQTTIPNTEQEITAQLMEGGMGYHMSNQVPRLVGENVERCLLDAFGSLGIAGVEWNNLFWAIHPGGRKILDKIEEVLRLEAGKLAASRKVLSEYGNMSGSTTIFVLDELRTRRAAKERDEEPAEWGVTMSFGPGMTLETMVLHVAHI